MKQHFLHTEGGLFPNVIEKSARISDCGQYRFSLSRIWDNSKPYVLFVMLNPSTADAYADDPTIRRCITFSKSWGYGGIMVGNRSPYRATDPKELKTWIQDEVIVEANRAMLKAMHLMAGITVCAWGNPPCRLPELTIYDNLYHLGLTKYDEPKHPLYLKSNLKPQRWKQH